MATSVLGIGEDIRRLITTARWRRYGMQQDFDRTRFGRIHDVADHDLV